MLISLLIIFIITRATVSIAVTVAEHLNVHVWVSVTDIQIPHLKLDFVSVCLLLHAVDLVHEFLNLVLGLLNFESLALLLGHDCGEGGLALDFGC